MKMFTVFGSLLAAIAAMCIGYRVGLALGDTLVHLMNLGA